MSGVRRRDEGLAREIEQIRQALGAVALAVPAVFWVYRRQDGRWWARREGDDRERCFESKADACAHVELLAARCRSWRLFVEDENGGFAAEHAGWPAAMRRLIGEDGAPVDPD
jgi:hypothetical protein